MKTNNKIPKSGMIPNPPDRKKTPRKKRKTSKLNLFNWTRRSWRRSEASLFDIVSLIIDAILGTDMTEEERTALVANPELTEFVDFHSKVLERMLSDNYDYIRDYKAGAESGM
jgi:hypothetical protein